jgi:hypothetical protein
MRPPFLRTSYEHVQWAKARALAYLPADTAGALASLASDLGKHPDTRQHRALQQLPAAVGAGQLSTAEQIQEFIEKCN